ncbi:MAG: sugar isomerase domain-containing protein [Actinomycetales bacterium]
MKAHQKYLENLISKLSELKSSDSSIERAAQVFADSLAKDGLIHIFGTGHSHMLAEEMFYRAGGLGSVNPILEEDLMLHINASRSTELERDANLANAILAKHPLKAGEVFIIASNSGGNALIEAMANEVKKRGLTLIAITSLRHAKSKEARSQSKKLHEIADIVIDNLGEVGDAAISYPDLDEKVGPTSSVIGTAIINAITVRAVEILLERGVKPTVFSSSNTASGDEHNNELIAQLKERIAIL